MDKKYVSIVLLILGICLSLGCMESDSGTTETTQPATEVIDCGVSDVLVFEGAKPKATGSDDVNFNDDEALVCMANALLNNCSQAKATLGPRDLATSAEYRIGINNSRCVFSLDFGDAPENASNIDKKLANTHLECSSPKEGFDEINQSLESYEKLGSLTGGMVLLLLFIAPSDKNCSGSYIKAYDEVMHDLVYTRSSTTTTLRPSATVPVLETTSKKLPYANITHPQVIGGKLAYVVNRGGKYFVVYGGREGKEYDYISYIIEVGDKPAYLGVRGGSEYVVWEGESNPYETASQLTEVDGKPAYVVGVDCSGSGFYCRQKFVVYNGTEGKRYDRVSSLVEVDGSLAYVAEEGGQQFMVREDVEGEKYDSIPIMLVVGGDLVYVLKNSYQTRVFRGGERIELHRNTNFLSMRDINGKLTYISHEHDLSDSFVVYGDRKGDYYRWFSMLTEVGGDLAYVVPVFRGSSVVYKGVEGRIHKVIFSLGDVDGELAYVAGEECDINSKTCNVSYMFYRDSRSEGYDKILGPLELGGELAFLAKRGGSFYLVANQ